ncbi:MAG: dinitrogenase iron-molybdenum cofactor biosynthesis protein [Clostridiaceae bacterium]|jgi:predicted Fe-Mo cluster-binding NifX family protein|nr:dinitrogenase iron-molybdenum cofactor biosynthesis protein [Clostridiaceae bacterium]
MRIAIPVDEKNIDSSVCVSFGRTPYFLIYDTDSKNSEFIDNSAAASTGGAGIKAAQTLVDKETDTLITPRCGENAADVLKSADIKIYKSKGSSINNNIEALLSGKLNLLDEIHPGFHGH